MDLAFRVDHRTRTTRLRQREIAVRGAPRSLSLARRAPEPRASTPIVTLDRRARPGTRRRDADRALARGEIVGPAHGVPFTIKDTFETAGLRTTCGWDDHRRPRPVGRRDRRRAARARPAASCSARRTCRRSRATCRPTTRSSARPTTRGIRRARRAARRAAPPRPIAAGPRRAARSAATSADRSARRPTGAGSTATSRRGASSADRGHIPGPPGTLVETSTST